MMTLSTVRLLLSTSQNYESIKSHWATWENLNDYFNDTRLTFYEAMNCDGHIFHDLIFTPPVIFDCGMWPDLNFYINFTVTKQ